MHEFHCALRRRCHLGRQRHGGSDRRLLSRGGDHRQGVSTSFLAKIFPKLEKAGIVAASKNVRGGYRLARPAKDITFLTIVDAIEGDKPLFDCQEVSRCCAVFGASRPGWVTDNGVCAKGSLNEYELHFLRQRSLSARYEKARRERVGCGGARLSGALT
jgi:Rrf2 family protein